MYTDYKTTLPLYCMYVIAQSVSTNILAEAHLLPTAAELVSDHS